MYGGHFGIRIKATELILWQSYRAFMDALSKSCINHHPAIMKAHVFVTYVKRILMENFIIVILASLMHILIVQRSRIRQRFSFTNTLFIFLSKTFISTIRKPYAIFVKNQCKKANGCIGVNNVILMSMHFVPSFQDKWYMKHSIRTQLHWYHVHLAKPCHVHVVAPKWKNTLGAILVDYNHVDSIFIRSASFFHGNHFVISTSLIDYLLSGYKKDPIVQNVGHQGYHGFIIVNSARWTYMLIVWTTWIPNKRNVIELISNLW